MKAVIPAAGRGTRFLPVTRSIPKEMLPIVDTPAIQLVVEEALAAGLDEIIVVTRAGKSAIEDHLAGVPRIRWVRQEQPLGLGHAVLAARDVVGDEPFAVLLPDDLFDATPPAIAQLTDVFRAHGKGAIACLDVPFGQEHLYNTVSGRQEGALIHVTDLVEKPPPGSSTTNLVGVGRYVLPPSVWPILAQQPPGAGGEIQLTDALATLARREGLVGARLHGERHDAGDRLGYLRANLAYALQRPELADGVRAICKEILSR